MNILIANAPCYLDNGKGVILFPSRWDSGVNGKPLFHFYPYEMASLSALLKRERDEGRLAATSIKMLDGNVEGWDGDRYIQEIKKHRPDVLICELSALTYPTMTRVMQEAMGAIKSMGSPTQLVGKRAILCGPMGSYDKERAYADGWTDVVTGEYELKVLELLGGTVPDKARVNGLVNLDWLPWPEDEDIRRERYYEINHYAPPAVVQIYNATRGCPLSCSFCSVPGYYGGHGKTSRSHRTRNVEDVCDEIEYLVSLGKYQGWQFNSAYFNEEAHSANPEWLASFCEELIRRRLNKYQYDAMCVMWTFTPDLVELCAKAGYKQIRFGVESTSEEVGKSIKKTIHKKKTEDFLAILKKNNIGAYITLQCGAMGSTEQSDLATIADAKEWIRKGWVQKWQYSTSTPQIGTPFYDLCQKNGWLVTENPEHFDGYRATVNFPGYSATQIQHVRDTAGL